MERRLSDRVVVRLYGFQQITDLAVVALLLKHNLDDDVLTMLQRHGHEARSVGVLGMALASDDDIAVYAWASC